MSMINFIENKFHTIYKYPSFNRKVFSKSANPLSKTIKASCYFQELLFMNWNKGFRHDALEEALLKIKFLFETNELYRQTW